VGKHVLVVEDDPRALEALKTVLEFEGYAVSTASSCSETLSRMRRPFRLPSLLLLDTRLPDGPALEVVEVMRRDRVLAGLPVLLMTSDAEAAVHLRGSSVLAVIRKPFDMATLLVEVASSLRCNDHPVARVTGAPRPTPAYGSSARKFR
jgi:two-component system chemotaxis sensor kinase CheA